MRRLILASIVFLTVAVRLIGFPHRDELRNIDECSYLTGGLDLLEGCMPGYKAAPGGLLFWSSWAYAGTQAAWHVIQPGAEERAVPLQVRPFVALEHALFDNYRDLSDLHIFVLAMLVALSAWAAAGATRLGFHHGGMFGAILAGGFFAVGPLFVGFSLMSRPYVMGWDFTILSLAAAATRDRKRIGWAGFFLGLAISSRIEMLAAAPLVAWEFWDRPTRLGIWRSVWRMLCWAALVTLLVSPWLLTSIIGELRAIATIRFSTPIEGPTPWTISLKDLMWYQATALVWLVVLAGLIWNPAARVRYIVLLSYILLMVVSLLHERGPGIYQHGPIFVGLILLVALSARVLERLPPKWAWWTIAAILGFPLLQTCWMFRGYHNTYMADGSVDWIEQHVPAGTIVYTTLYLPGPRALLPTKQSGDRIWDEINSVAVSEHKFQQGLNRFGLPASVIPPALGEENMTQERGIRRVYYILTGRPDYPAPRYDLHSTYGSVFGSLDPGALHGQWMKTGGVVEWENLYSPEPVPAELGTPIAKWESRAGQGMYIFCSPDVVAKLK